MASPEFVAFAVAGHNTTSVAMTFLWNWPLSLLDRVSYYALLAGLAVFRVSASFLGPARLSVSFKFIFLLHFSLTRAHLSSESTFSPTPSSPVVASYQTFARASCAHPESQLNGKCVTRVDMATKWCTNMALTEPKAQQRQQQQLQRQQRQQS